MHKPKPSHYGAVAMLFHWSIAALVLIDFGFAVSFSQFNPGDAGYLKSAYSLHMSTGIGVLVLSALCVLWRMLHRYPPALADLPPTWRFLAKAAHALLYCFILAAPLSGWAVLSLRKQPTSLFDRLEWPALPALAGMSHDQRQAWHEVLLPAHAWVSYLGIVLVGVHILAALYHHYYRHDEVLRRMLPRWHRPLSPVVPSAGPGSRS